MSKAQDIAAALFADQSQTDQFTSLPQNQQDWPEPQLEFGPDWREELIDTTFFVVQSTIEEGENEKEEL